MERRKTERIEDEGEGFGGGQKPYLQEHRNHFTGVVYRKNEQALRVIGKYSLQLEELGHVSFEAGKSRYWSVQGSAVELHLCSQFPARPGVWLLGAKDNNRVLRSKCSAVSKTRTHEYADVLQNGLPVIKWPHETVEDDIEGDEALKIVPNKIKELVETVKSMLESMEDGETSSSAYDTAWVSLVEDADGSGLPQFPSCLEWIADHQHSDGSWGDGQMFTAHDRLINTIACVVALKTWNLHPEKCEKGLAYFNENIHKLGAEHAEHMPIGFEVVFPSILEVARSLNLKIPNDCPVLEEIYTMRNLKLKKIPRDIMHKVPTSLLHSLEAMGDLEWEKILKLQSPNGSFLFSPSATAYALMKTRDPKCMSYLAKLVHKFKGGVPTAYPLDIFEHAWIVDRFQRLGISRYFQPQIKECINYVKRYWTENGIGWGRNIVVPDLDDTVMAFRLMRLHGHQVSTDVLEHFKKGDEFVFFPGQSTEAVTGMFNLYRASQVMFTGETVLNEAMEFSSKFLRRKQASNELQDKWIIAKDLPGEVGYALEVPFYANLPRLETRFYLEQYGGGNDVWIGKTLYRMYLVSNDVYLELAKLDYNSCQAVHLVEWNNIQKWYAECRLEEYGLSRRSLLMAYYVAAASIFEPERAVERLAWAKTACLMETVASLFKEETPEDRNVFIQQFKIRKKNTNKKGQGLLETLLATLHHLSLDAIVAHGQDISYSLRHAWEKWLLKWEEDDDMHHDEAELLVETINQTAGLSIPKGLLANPKYEQLFNLTNKVCNKLHCLKKPKNNKENENGSYIVTNKEIDSDMQQLVQIVFENPSSDLDSEIKHTFFAVARSFYYSAYFDHETVYNHLIKVLFERAI